MDLRLRAIEIELSLKSIYIYIYIFYKIALIYNLTNSNLFYLILNSYLDIKHLHCKFILNEISLSPYICCCLPHRPDIICQPKASRK